MCRRLRHARAGSHCSAVANELWRATGTAVGEGATGAGAATAEGFAVAAAIGAQIAGAGRLGRCALRLSWLAAAFAMTAAAIAVAAATGCQGKPVARGMARGAGCRGGRVCAGGRNAGHGDDGGAVAGRRLAGRRLAGWRLAGAAARHHARERAEQPERTADCGNPGIGGGAMGHAARLPEVLAQHNLISC